MRTTFGPRRRKSPSQHPPNHCKDVPNARNNPTVGSEYIRLLIETSPKATSKSPSSGHLLKGVNVMANKSLFSSLTKWLPRADARNEAGGLAYKLTPKHALAQLAATGCFNNTFYADAETQLEELLNLAGRVD